MLLKQHNEIADAERAGKGGGWLKGLILAPARICEDHEGFGRRGGLRFRRKVDGHRRHT